MHQAREAFIPHVHPPKQPPARQLFLMTIRCKQEEDERNRKNFLCRQVC